jgi:hypothetical protein
MFIKKNLSILLATGSFTATALADISSSEYHPDRLPYSALLDGPPLGDSAGVLDSAGEQQQPLFDALSSEGLISITDIPGFAPLKKSLMQWLHTCIIDQGPNAQNVLEIIQKDGTIRRTIASVTLPGQSGGESFDLKGGEDSPKSLSPSCQEFSKNLDKFRDQVAEVVSTFSDRLTTEMSYMYEEPLLVTEDGAYSFNSIKDVVSSGEHLEHFHSYQKFHGQSASMMKASKSLRSSETIELHTDQGFFIAFVPGLMVSHSLTSNKPDVDIPLTETPGFYIEKRDGTKAHVQFDSEDDLIFMMGDGVNQYVNPKMTQDSIANKRILRATPHSVTLPAHDEHLSRVWYGRMVLPPKVAFSDRDGKTHGQVRSLISDTDIAPGGIGCSSYSPDVNNSNPRSLSGGGGDTAACEEGEMFCWFRCMNLVEHNAHTCADRNLQTKCINPRDQVVPDGKKHGDYYPGCSNSEEPVTAYPKLDNYPQDPDICTDAEWDKFSDSVDYDHSFDLSTDKTTAKFMWSIVDDKVHGKIAFHGLFGFLATGLVNLEEGAGHNGMNGASILMAVPSDEYSPVEGFDFSKDATIGEYVIDLKDSAFRHWSEPITDSTSSVTTNLINDECFTSFTFEADGINSKMFNLEGKDTMLWAGNTMDKFAGYHSKNRAKFEVEWATGKAVSLNPVENPNGASSIIPTTLVIVVSVLATFLL